MLGMGQLPLRLLSYDIGSRRAGETSQSTWGAPVQYGDLARTSKLPQTQLRAGLLVLIQHNYVNVYLKQVGGLLP